MRAVLALADGTILRGRGFGAQAVAVGELCFNTAMSGYQEILTDPSYARQIVTLTYPHIGNVGVNGMDAESARIHCAGLVIRDLPAGPSNWRSERGLSAYLADHGVPGIAELDTRRLTRILREKGAQGAALAVGDDPDAESALAAARAFPGLAGMDLAKEVSCDAPYAWAEGSGDPARGYAPAEPAQLPRHVVVYDFGTKRNILRLLADRGCHITVVPATTPAREVLALGPDGVLFSNGPGDPEPVDYGQRAMQEIIAAGIPSFGLCLGHQLLGLALGGRTVKMKFGHHGANHPVKDLDTGRVLITSQNHGFAVDAETLPDCLRVTHISLFDGSLQGLAHRDLPVLSFQGHPEASPGPHDAGVIFDRFISLIDQHREARHHA